MDQRISALAGQQQRAQASSRYSYVQAWDLPTRIFKWSLASLVVVAWISSSFDDPTMTVHKAAGYGLLTLLVYRVLWGFLGGSTARFASFVRSPSAAIAYLRDQRRGGRRRYLGHNPAGGLMIVALLLACAIQVALGLFASDGVTASGPFADRVGETVAAWAGELHGAWLYVVLSLAAVHIGVNFYYQFIKKENLIGAMITGRKRRGDYVDAKEARGGSPLLAALCLSVAVTLVYLGVKLPGGQFFAAL
jgi:cytochrome b